MEHTDEKILDLMNEMEKRKEKKDIHDKALKIGERYYEFEERKFYDDKLSIIMPKDFEEMDEKSKNFKYPSVNRPQIIKTDDTTTINITLNKVDNDLKEEWVEELTKGMKQLIKKANPTAVFYEDGVEKVDEKNIGYFEFKSSALDDFLYNLMFFLEFEEKTLMGTFSCLFSDYEDWRDIAFQMLKSIKVSKGED